MRTLLLLALLFAAVPAQARLSREEQAMTASVDREANRTIALLERMVNRNSGTLNLEGVTAVGEMVRAELAPLGFDVRWIDMHGTGRAGHIVATHRGNGCGKRVLLIGHLDTVFEPDSPFQAFARAGKRATGPGVGDCKGGDVVAIAALRAMQAAGTLRDADIMVVMTGDDRRRGLARHCVRQDQHHPGHGDRARRYPRADPRAGGARSHPYAGDRRPSTCRAPRPSWSFPRTAIRRWRRPPATAPCSPGSTS